MGNADALLQPIVQYGFAGFCAVLLGIVFWLVKRLLAVLEATNAVIARNSEAISDLSSLTSDLLKLNRSLHDKLISRPCIAKGEHGANCG
ncbi:MAG: hypothetical protein ABFD92_16770 [Planctomycetaceae bacterium]|nr:hypothetical protein [Planctomycetaceae bacterium]